MSPELYISGLKVYLPGLRGNKGNISTPRKLFKPKDTQTGPLSNQTLIEIAWCTD